MIGEIFVGLLFAGSVWFAYVCGRTDCQKNGCYRGTKENEDGQVFLCYYR